MSVFERRRQDPSSSPVLVRTATRCHGAGRISSAVAVLVLGTVACSDRPAVLDPSLGTDSLSQSADELIGGFPICTSRLNAVGSILMSHGDPNDPDPAMDDLEPICTATLVGPSTVVTAEHCRIDWTSAAFGVGFDAHNPERVVPIVGWALETTVDGGFLGMGSDVAVAHLAEPLEEITPLGLGVFAENDIGRRYLGIGYGVQDNDWAAGTRKVGRMTLQGIRGNVYELIFGDFESFCEVAIRAWDLPENDPWVEEELRRLYDEAVLLDEYEALLGNGQGDAQACRGDVGGPIIGRVDGQMKTFGVISWVDGSSQLACDWGTVVATFGPAARELVEREIACPLVPAEGVCEGTVAVRCSGPAEGLRRILRTECADLGLICGFDEAGEIGCL